MAFELAALSQPPMAHQGRSAPGRNGGAASVDPILIGVRMRKRARRVPRAQVPECFWNIAASISACAAGGERERPLVAVSHAAIDAAISLDLSRRHRSGRIGHGRIAKDGTAHLLSSRVEPT
jgi:hypothetical protein